MYSSSFVWSGKKYSPKQLIDILSYNPLPLVAKVNYVSEEYQKSCPEMAIETLFWLYEVGSEDRVALKTTDNKHISVPQETTLKFETVYVHERGPPTTLKSMLQGKANSELKIEISGNPSNKLSSMPDKSNMVRYGTFQVVGIYQEKVLKGQMIVSGSGELKPGKRKISANFPITLDFATGLFRKSADEFKMMKEKLKEKQSDEADASQEVVLLSSLETTVQELHQLRHICHLYHPATNIKKFRKNYADTDNSLRKDQLDARSSKVSQKNPRSRHTAKGAVPSSPAPLDHESEIILPDYDKILCVMDKEETVTNSQSSDVCSLSGIHSQQDNLTRSNEGHLYENLPNATSNPDTFDGETYLNDRYFRPLDTRKKKKVPTATLR